MCRHCSRGLGSENSVRAIDRGGVAAGSGSAKRAADWHLPFYKAARFGLAWDYGGFVVGGVGESNDRP